MKRIIDTSEVLGTVEAPGGMCELCASADASFDEAAGRLVVKLEAFLRPADLLAKERRFRADWLRENETVAESVAREECHEADERATPRDQIPRLEPRAAAVLRRTWRPVMCRCFRGSETIRSV